MRAMAEPAPTTSPLVRRYDIEEFWALEPPPEGGKWELIAGVLCMVPPPSVRHACVVSQLNRFLVQFTLASSQVARVFVPSAAVWTRRPATWLEPDLFMVSGERVVAAAEAGFASAELVVEVASPSTTLYDRTTKADTYAAVGVRELWLVDSESRTLECRVLEGRTWRPAERFTEGDVVESEAFPGLRLRVGDVFADLRDS